MEGGNIDIDALMGNIDKKLRDLDKKITGETDEKLAKLWAEIRRLDDKIGSIMPEIHATVNLQLTQINTRIDSISIPQGDPTAKLREIIDAMSVQM